MMFQSPEFWVAVAFIIFIASTARPIWLAVTKALDNRANSIRDELAAAQNLREEAQATLAEYKRKQRDTAKEAEAIIRQAREEAARSSAQGKKDLEQTLVRRQQLAVDRIAQAEATAVKDVRSIAVEVAIAAASKVLKKQLAGEEGSKLVDEAIKELPTKLH